MFLKVSSLKEEILSKFFSVMFLKNLLKYRTLDQRSSCRCLIDQARRALMMIEPISKKLSVQSVFLRRLLLRDLDFVVFYVLWIFLQEFLYLIIFSKVLSLSLWVKQDFLSLQVRLFWYVPFKLSFSFVLREELAHFPVRWFQTTDVSILKKLAARHNGY